jgi:hypothetical protein
VANNRKATRRRCARQEKVRQPPKKPPDDPELRDLIRNLNWLLALVRTAVESEAGRSLADRLGRLASAACIIDGLTLDSGGWAALLGLKNARSFSKVKTRRKVFVHKPGQTLMVSAGDLLRASARGVANDDEGDDGDDPE